MADDDLTPTPVTRPTDRPIFVVGPPSSGQVAMRESLVSAPGLWRASFVAAAPEYGVDEGDPGLGDRRTAPPASGAAERMRQALEREFQSHEHGALPGDAVPRPIGVEPALALWIPFLAAAFPDALFLYLHRAPQLAVRDAEGEGRSAWQWATIAETALDDLGALDPGRWRLVDTAGLLSEPEGELQRVFAFLEVGWHAGCSAPWRALSRVRTDDVAEPLAEPLARIERRVADHLGGRREPAATAASRREVTAVDSGLGDVLRTLGSSLLVSTYQSNRLMVLREDGGRLGVHLRSFDRPMGIAITPQGFALGTRSEVVDLRDSPAVAERLEPPGRHDACFLPRNSHVTGDIAVHDLAFGRDGLWVVATRFSCLATLDVDHSFVPRWRPPFITALAPEDRCHLNGVAMVDGRPRYVTALGATDTPGGWRQDKASGGVVVDVASGEVVVAGLSMPHSPRWHDGRLWVLESGRGLLSVCDLAAGTTEPVAELPGFARGLSIHGGTAFVGTSQVRETATFGGLPISALPQRECGVWAVDLADGSVRGAVRFESRVEEVFDVAVVAERRFPEVAETSSDLTRESWHVPPPRRDPAGRPEH